MSLEDLSLDALQDLQDVMDQTNLEAKWQIQRLKQAFDPLNRCARAQFIMAHGDKITSGRLFK